MSEAETNLDKLMDQKYITSVILQKLHKFFPNAIVAGGAACDWYFEKPARDIDIFFTMDDTLTKQQCLIVISNVLGIDVYCLSKTEGSGYGDSEYLRFVFETEYLGETFQFVVTNKDPVATIDSFPSDVVKIYWKDGNYFPVGLFEFSHQQKILVVDKDKLNKSKNDYVLKLRNKFPSYTYIETTKDLMNHFKNKGVFK